MKQLIVLIVFSLFATNCNRKDSEDFSLMINHYAGGPGLTIIYRLDEKGLQVNMNCDLEDCQEKTVYKRTFTKSERDSVFNFINSLQLDTLKSSYKTKGILDGLVTRLSFRKGIFSSHTTTFSNFDTPAT